MQIVVKGKNIDVNETLRSYVEKKASKLARYLDHIMDVTAELSEEKTKSSGDRYVIQMLLTTNNTVLRAEEKAGDIYTAVDAVLNVMQRQLVRHKEKLYSRAKTSVAKAVAAEVESAILEEALQEEKPHVVKIKRFLMKPMAVEEAAAEMEALGHDFFVFLNAATEQINVLYRRRDGNYGLIEPELI
ncbi:MAG: ribosome-associated translation inhibitor RaiA [Chloroflexi bacterium]|nr:ribosome-associated translation inhibitor RaiA [Chloroflexota bacterium]MCL5075165.1 ribosome-associated translation inhibitor RaiA [Chloroflexota bacterium]